MKNAILIEAQKELSKHIWDNYVTGDGVAIGQGGQGVVEVGCVSCKRAFQTSHQHMRHLAEDVLPGIVDMVIERTAIAEN
jgi:hypothetical protein